MRASAQVTGAACDAGRVPVRDRLLAVLVALLWGLNFIAIDLGMADLPPLMFVAIRFVFVVFPAIFFVPKPDAPWRTILLIGAFMSLGQFSLLYLAISLGMPAGMASLVLQAQVLFTVLLAWVGLRERPRSEQLVGVLIGTVGLAIIAVAHGMQAPVIPLFVTLAAAAAWAIGNVLVRQAKVASGLSMVVWSGIVVPLPALALSLVLDGPAALARGFAGFGWTAVLGTAYTVIAASLIGYTIFNSLLAGHPATSVVPYILLVPVVGIASAWLVMNEVPSAGELIGAAIMLVGVAVAGGSFALRSRSRASTDNPDAT